MFEMLNKDLDELSVNKAILKLFKCYLVDNSISDNKDNETQYDKKALSKGILIDKNVPNDIKEYVIKVYGKDGYLLNQTFHKSFDKVLKSSKLELIIEQVLHYYTTYGKERMGFDYDENKVYIPKEKLEVIDLKDDITLIKINPINKNNLNTRLRNLILDSNIALSSDTIKNIEVLLKFMDIKESEIDLIKNREVKVLVYKYLNIVPKDNIEFLRFLIYVLTESTLLIKSPESEEALKISKKSQALKYLEKYDEISGYNVLSQIFNRFKPLFLSLKTNKESDKELSVEEEKVNSIINKISHLSKKYHKPFITNELDKFKVWCKENIDKSEFEKILRSRLNGESTYRIIKLDNYLRYLSLGNSSKVYKIRNGRCFITIKEDLDFNNINYKKVIDLLDSIILQRMNEKVTDKKIYLDDKVSIKLPQSEKQFIGDIPYGTSITLDKEDLLFGIHWNDVENKRVDLDLKAISNDFVVGWDGDFKKDDKIIFSGDVTSAPLPNGASEYLYIDKSIDDTILSIKLNNYTSYLENIEYDIIIAKGYKKKIKRNFIIDPNDIIIRIPKNKIEKNMTEHMLASIIIKNDLVKLVFTDLTTSKNITSFETDLEEVLRNYIELESESKCDLKEFLLKSNAIIVNKEKDADINLNIENLSKDSIIKLL